MKEALVTDAGPPNSLVLRVLALNNKDLYNLAGGPGFLLLSLIFLALSGKFQCSSKQM